MGPHLKSHPTDWWCSGLRADPDVGKPRCSSQLLVITSFKSVLFSQILHLKSNWLLECLQYFWIVCSVDLETETEREVPLRADTS